MIDDVAVWDAAYVLGALSREDRHVYEAYLVSNPERAASLTELAGLPGILNMLSCDEAIALTEHADDVPAEAPAVDLMPSLAIAAAGQQRRSRRSMLAVGLAGAAAVAIGAGAFGATVLPRQGPRAEEVTRAGHAADGEGRDQRGARRHGEEMGHAAGLDVRIRRGLGEDGGRPTTSS